MLLLFVAIFIVRLRAPRAVVIVRRNPERVLEVLLPPFDVVARAMRPLTGGLVQLIAEPRRDRPERTARAAEEETARTPHTRTSRRARSRG